MKILITGAAGFIGAAVAERLLGKGARVYGVDNLNDYYDVNLKRMRLKRLQAADGFSFRKADIADRDEMASVFSEWAFDAVFHAAAQAGVRYSLENPEAYIQSNLVGFWNVLGNCKATKVGHFVFASSSSVYGANAKVPFSERHGADRPVSLYAATKRADELLAYSYAHLFHLPCTGVRFFTVYGPWGRPDMALFSFTDAMRKGRAIDVFNQGDMRRDFTYIDDAVTGVVKLIDHIPRPDAGGDATDDPAGARVPYRIYNLGSHNPKPLMELIACLEEELGIKAVKNMLPMQPGDVYQTFADIGEIEKAIGFSAPTSLREGVKRFVRWYREYYAPDG